MMVICQSKDIRGVVHCHLYEDMKPPDAVISHRSRYPEDTHFWAIGLNSKAAKQFPEPTVYEQRG